MLTDPKTRSALGLLTNGENAIKRELIDPLDPTGGGGGGGGAGGNNPGPQDDRLLVGSFGVSRTGAPLPYPLQPTPSKQPLQGFDQIWGPSRTDGMNQRLHSPVIGMTHYWPTYDSLPQPPASTTVGDPPPEPNPAEAWNRLVERHERTRVACSASTRHPRPKRHL
ncbi:hypothetical protein ZHAS_00011516 [Anopheles sinensis]|uniref:Uncharacterized protein n=1 Tax=Anopheles sinensis TaxID=74873 RepID=A0A084W0N2_ANOSI|nr:hypothetical protein ZHAS_00011516 [Anopheles sinensis]